DWETDDDGDPLTAGTFITDQFADLGLNITATEFGAMIFDTQNPTGDDIDLASDVLGNVLIISQDGDASDPDDNRDGGAFEFTFDQPIRYDRTFVLDMDFNEVGSRIRTFDADGALISDTPIPTAGDNQLDLVTIGDEMVSRIVVDFVGSGAIEEFTFTDIYRNTATVSVDGHVFDTDNSSYTNPVPDPVDDPFVGPTPGDDPAEVIEGTDDKDVLRGTSTSELILAGDGSDKVFGGAGDDVIVAGGGNDYRLEGGRGADTFRFSSHNDTNVIRDFEDGVDKIAFEGLSFEDLQIIDEPAKSKISILTPDGYGTKVVIVYDAPISLTAEDFMFSGSDPLEDMMDDNMPGDGTTDGDMSDDDMTGDDMTDGDIPHDGGGMMEDPLDDDEDMNDPLDDDEVTDPVDHQGGMDDDDPLEDIADLIQVNGSDGRDVLRGTDAAEIFFAGGGTDKVFAGGGDDVVVAGAGTDFRLEGGSGADTFLFSQMNSGNYIRDFEDGIDQIAFEGIGFADLTIEDDAAGGRVRIFTPDDYGTSVIVTYDSPITLNEDDFQFVPLM
ncbi:MAG: hypothetical protein AAFP98_11900, partial [Pseudomonadota bacterium]